jgi:hypothetical protein
MDCPLYAVNESGKEVITSLLEPLFSILLAAFINHAEEIEIRASQSGSKEVFIDYQKENQRIPLTPTKDFHPFITSSRIRIISGMSIKPDLQQKGEMRVQFNKTILLVGVEVALENEWEILRFKPHWI